MEFSTTDWHRFSRRLQKLLNQEKLVQGPYVEALPDFEKGQPLSKLLKSAGGFLHDGLSQLESTRIY